MSYKDKVKKAMELDTVKDLFPIYLKENKQLDDLTLNYDLHLDYPKTITLDIEGMHNEYFVSLAFPHIKTLQQFEDLYKALTGKELGSE